MTSDWWSISDGVTLASDENHILYHVVAWPSLQAPFSRESFGFYSIGKLPLVVNLDPNFQVAAARVDPDKEQAEFMLKIRAKLEHMLNLYEQDGLPRVADGSVNEELATRLRWRPENAQHF